MTGSLSFLSGSERESKSHDYISHSKISSGWSCVPCGGTDLINVRLCMLGTGMRTQEKTGLSYPASHSLSGSGFLFLPGALLDSCFFMKSHPSFFLPTSPV